MAPRLRNLVKMNVDTAGTGSTFHVTTAVSGFRSLDGAGFADGQDVIYCLRDGASSEMGHGAYDATAKTIVRNVTSSTNADARINLTGSARLLVTPRAVDIDPRAMTAKTTLAIADILALLDSGDDDMKSATVGAILAAVGVLSSDASPDRFVDRLLSYDISASAAKRIAFPAPRGHIFGSMVANNATDATNDIDFSPGECASDNADARFLVNASALTKQLDAVWVAGTNQGMRDPTSNGGAITDGTWHLFRIGRSDTGVCDYFASLSTTPTLPTNYDYKRRIAAILREGGAIVPFAQDGDLFLRKTPVLDFDSGLNPGSSALTIALKVPTGIPVISVFNGGVINSGSVTQGNFLFSDLAISDQAPQLTNVAPLSSAGAYPINSGGGSLYSFGEHRVRTNTSGQIRGRLGGSDGSIRLLASSKGWIDPRGRLN